jgi:hypothetical protein
MRRIFPIVVVMIFFIWQNVNAQKKKPTYFDYKFSMEDCASETLLFEDSLLIARFNIAQKGIAIRLENKSDKPLLIIWDETNYIHGSNAMRVMHNGVKYADRNNSQAPTLIPPGAAINDEVTPTDNVSFYSGGRYTSAEWLVAPLFPLHDAGLPDRKKTILDMKGSQIGLFMTIQRGENKLNYHWKFNLEEINEK